MNTQIGYYTVGNNKDTSNSGIKDLTSAWKFPCGGKTCDITITGYTIQRGNYNAVTGPYVTLSSFLRSSLLRNKAGEMTVVIKGLKASTKYTFVTYHHDTFTGGKRTGKITLQYKGTLDVL